MFSRIAQSSVCGALNTRQSVASEEGQALTEFGLILALITVVCIAALTALGIAVGAFYTDFEALLP